MKDLLEGREIICEMIFGSRMYGTDTPDSDMDIKGIYLPTLEERRAGQFPKSLVYSSGNDKSKNTKEDVDYEYYSLDYFITLAKVGETVAIDMLHSNETLRSSPIWERIVKERQRFISKNMQAYLGYCQKQAAKYGLKGSRLDTIQRVSCMLAYHCYPYQKMAEIWDDLPGLEHTKKDEEFYNVCGRKLQKTAKVKYCLDILEQFEYTYGERAREAIDNNNVDWKAMSHAVRASTQLIDLFLYGEIKYPLHNAKDLKAIKQGEWDFTYTLQRLEGYIESVKYIAQVTDYPEAVDSLFWEGFLQQVIYKQKEKEYGKY